MVSHWHVETSLTSLNKILPPSLKKPCSFLTAASRKDVIAHTSQNIAFWSQKSKLKTAGAEPLLRLATTPGSEAIIEDRVRNSKNKERSLSRGLKNCWLCIPDQNSQLFVRIKWTSKYGRFMVNYFCRKGVRQKNGFRRLVWIGIRVRHFSKFWSMMIGSQL